MYQQVELRQQLIINNLVHISLVTQQLSSTIGIVTTTSTAAVTTSFTGSRDWFNEQTLTLTGAGSTITWNSIVDRPGTSNFAASRNSRFDEIHVVVIDGSGDVTGNAGTILEKHVALSKAKDAEYSVGQHSILEKISLQYINKCIWWITTSRCRCYKL